jgi:hypothetical protein
MAAVLLLAQFDGLPSKRVMEIHPSIKLLKDLQQDNKIPVDPIPFG